jgi:glutaminase
MSAFALPLSPVQRYLDRLYEDLLGMTGGEVASYIPELTRANPSWLGIAVVTVDGHVYQVGDSRQTFTIQSISKAITYGLALEDRGLDYVLSRVGVEPSGEAFNSISLEPDTGRPLNPMINAGAIATTGMITATADSPPLARILDAFGRYTGRPMKIDETVYRSESETGHRNRAITHLLYGHGIIDRPPEEVLDLYFRQCSILVTARDLAVMGACLANDGVNPIGGVVALKSPYVKKVLSVMSTCGMYDYSGGWVFDVGMPAKSGVAGGIMAVLPGQFGLGVFSPPLDPKGNSVRGIEACKRLSSDLSLHFFHVARSTSESVVRNVYGCAKITSRRRRSPPAREVLAARGERIRVYELQGELLFGSTESVTLEMLSALSQIDYLVVDLKRVVAIDEASIRILVELCPAVLEQGRRVFFTDWRHLYRFRKLLKRQIEPRQEPSLLEFEDTDHAVEWCENQLIAEAGAADVQGPAMLDMSQQYLCAGMTAEEIETLRRAGSTQRFPAGATIFRVGEEGHSLFFILDGEVEVSIDTDSNRRLRLTTLGPGMVFGEIALLSRTRRTANVLTTTETTCLEIPFDAIDDAVKIKMLANMASYFAGKIEHDTQLIRQLG